jgi:hypothetical protein
MDEMQTARLLFLTAPERGVWILNVQNETGDLMRFQVSKQHLFDLNKQAADILVKEFK